MKEIEKDRESIIDEIGRYIDNQCIPFERLPMYIQNFRPNVKFLSSCSQFKNAIQNILTAKRENFFVKYYDETDEAFTLSIAQIID